MPRAWETDTAFNFLCLKALLLPFFLNLWLRGSPTLSLLPGCSSFWIYGGNLLHLFQTKLQCCVKSHICLNTSCPVCPLCLLVRPIQFPLIIPFTSMPGLRPVFKLPLKPSFTQTQLPVSCLKNSSNVSIFRKSLVNKPPHFGWATGLRNDYLSYSSSHNSGWQSGQGANLLSSSRQLNCRQHLRIPMVVDLLPIGSKRKYCQGLLPGVS